MKVNKCVLRSRLIDEHPRYTLVLINGLNTNYTSLCSYYFVVLLTFYRFKLYDAALGLLCKSSCGPPSNLSLRPLLYTYCTPNTQRSPCKALFVFASPTVFPSRKQPSSPAGGSFHWLSSE